MEIIYNYVTINKINGKKYVGSHSTDDINDGYLGSGNLIKLAIKKYGKENFQKDILNRCLTKDEAFYNERFLIDMYSTLTPNGYNVSLVGGVGVPNCFSEETKLKMSNAKKGRKLTEEHKARIGKAGLGRVVTEETRKKIGRANKGKVGWSRGKRGEGTPTYGKRHSVEVRNKMSKSSKGISPANKGKCYTEKEVEAKWATIRKPVMQFTKKGVFLKEWNSIAVAGRNTGADKGNISTCAHGYRKSAHGFIWKFRDDVL